MGQGGEMGVKWHSRAETQALFILWFHPPLGSWNSLHSTGRWQKRRKITCKKFGEWNRADLKVVLIVAAHVSLPELSHLPPLISGDVYSSCVHQRMDRTQMQVSTKSLNHLFSYWTHIYEVDTVIKPILKKEKTFSGVNSSELALHLNKNQDKFNISEKRDQYLRGFIRVWQNCLWVTWKGEDEWILG